MFLPSLWYFSTKAKPDKTSKLTFTWVEGEKRKQTPPKRPLNEDEVCRRLYKLLYLILNIKKSTYKIVLTCCEPIWKKRDEKQHNDWHCHLSVARALNSILVMLVRARARTIHSPLHKLLKRLNHQKASWKSLLVLKSIIMRGGRSDSPSLSILERNQYRVRLKSWKSWFSWSSSHVLPHSHKPLLAGHLQTVFSFLLCILSVPKKKILVYCFVKCNSTSMLHHECFFCFKNL